MIDAELKSVTKLWPPPVPLNTKVSLPASPISVSLPGLPRSTSSPRPPKELVVAVPAIEGVVAGAASELVVSAAARDHVVQGVAHALESAGAGIGQVLHIGGQCHPRLGGDDRVAPAGRRLGDQLACHIDEVGVVSRSTDQRIGARQAVDGVIAGSALDQVVARRSSDDPRGDRRGEGGWIASA